MDQRVDARRLEGVPTDQQRVEREHLSQPLVLDIAGDEAIDHAIALQLHEVRHDLQHIADIQEGRIGQLGEAFVEDFLRQGNEPLVPLDVVFRVLAELPDRGDHVRRLAGVVEVLPIVEKDAVERIDGNHLDVIGRVAAGALEQLIDHPRGGDDGRPAVKFEAVLLIDVGAAARLVALVDQRDIMPFAGEANGGGQPAKTTSDNDDATTHEWSLSFGRRPPRWKSRDVALIMKPNVVLSIFQCTARGSWGVSGKRARC